ncbi:MAG: PEPxxWA-CTERM sorting domain-containing protein, partial [Polymorphobacter sp.]
HIKHLGPVSLPPAIITDGTPLGDLQEPTNVGTVPEPASWALMLAGFGVVGGALRRRNMARVAA